MCLFLKFYSTIGTNDDEMRDSIEFNQFSNSSSFGLIEIYLNYLHLKKQYGLLSIYTSKLPSTLQTRWYSKFCEGNRFIFFIFARQNCPAPHPPLPSPPL